MCNPMSLSSVCELSLRKVHEAAFTGTGFCLPDPLSGKTEVCGRDFSYGGLDCKVFRSAMVL